MGHKIEGTSMPLLSKFTLEGSLFNNIFHKKIFTLIGMQPFQRVMMGETSRIWESIRDRAEATVKPLEAIFLGNGLIAIVSGLFGNLLADIASLGPVAPFDAVACILAIGMAIILSSWGENYEDPSDNKDLLSQFKGAAVAIAL
ncbi:molybdate-anion transporter-like protein, partial [Tanacetum coccineum]